MVSMQKCPCCECDYPASLLRPFTDSRNKRKRDRLVCPLCGIAYLNRNSGQPDTTLSPAPLARQLQLLALESLETQNRTWPGPTRFREVFGKGAKA